MENIEREIRFRLAKDGGPLVKGDSYHAIIEKRVDQPIDAVPEIAATAGLSPVEGLGRRLLRAAGDRKWELVEGGYETFLALKGACYGLQKKENDPFRYR